MGDQKWPLLGQRPEKQDHIWPCGGCNLIAVLLKTSVARIRSKIIRVAFNKGHNSIQTTLCLLRDNLKAKKGVAFDSRAIKGRCLMRKDYES